jgi:hypothetical protein
MKTSDYYLNRQKISELTNENFIEILDNEKLGKIKGGISDPDPK